MGRPARPGGARERRAGTLGVEERRDGFLPAVPAGRCASPAAAAPSAFSARSGPPTGASREYAADAYAASLGQAEDLARYLSDNELPFDLPQPRLPFNRAEHPPVAMRIERLLAVDALGVSK